MDGSRRRVSPQARGGGTGGRAVRSEQVSSVRRTPGELPGAKSENGWVTGIITAGAAGTLHERGGHGHAVAQQAGSASQQAEAQVSVTGVARTSARPRGAVAKPKSSKRRAAGGIALT